MRHPFLIGEFLRARHGFDGVVLSDGGALSSLHRKPEKPDGHNLTDDVVETAALCLRTGCDLELGQHAYRFAGEAIERGLLTEAEIDRAVRRILRLRFELGVFDPPEDNPHARTPISVIQCEAHVAMAREAARKSIVLLKNEAGALPLSAERDHTVLVTGPLSVDLQILLGNFYKGASGRLVSLLEGITGEAPEGVTVTHSQGCFLNHPNHFESNWFLGLADWAATVVACVGYSPLMEGEQGECIGAPLGGDKDSIALPDNQLRFLRRLRERLDTLRRDQRLIVVVAGGAPLELEEVHALADAVVMVWYPGQEGGTALGRVLWGREDPGGRLPASCPLRLSDLPAYEDYSMRGRTYRYAEKALFYPFGYGLAYTPNQTELESLVRETDRVVARVRLNGHTEDVVQLYARWPDHPGTPTSALVAFKRVEAGISSVELSVDLHRLRPIGDDGNPVAGPVRVELTIAPCAPVPAVHTTVSAEPAWQSIELRGE